MFTVNKITLGSDNAQNHHTKELIESRAWMAENPRFKICKGDGSDLIQIAQSRFIKPVSVKVWMGRSSSATTVYASVWLRNRKGEFSSGRGSASGGGYHKVSAAIEEAFCDAGVEFSKHWGGSGNSPIQEAIMLTGHKLGFRAGGLV